MLRKNQSKALVCIVLFLSSISTHSYPWHMPWKSAMSFFKSGYQKNPGVTIATTAGLVAASLFTLYKIIRTPCNPPLTSDRLNIRTVIRKKTGPPTLFQKIKQHITRKKPAREPLISEKGIPDWIKDKETVAIFVPGFVWGSICPGAKNAGIRNAINHIKEGIIPSIDPTNDCYVPCITFDFLDQRTSANFGQKLDQQCLDFVIKEIIKKNPQAKIMLICLCRGALVALQLLADKTNESYKNIACLILNEPPTPYIHELIPPSNYNFLKKFYPNHNPQAKTFFDATFFPTSIPIFISALNNDAITRRSSQMIDKLISLQCENLYAFHSLDKQWNHGFVRNDDLFFLALNAFYKYHHLPYLDFIEDKNGQKFGKNEKPFEIIKDYVLKKNNPQLNKNQTWPF